MADVSARLPRGMVWAVLMVWAVRSIGHLLRRARRADATLDLRCQRSCNARPYLQPPILGAVVPRCEEKRLPTEAATSAVAVAARHSAARPTKWNQMASAE